MVIRPIPEDISGQIIPAFYPEGKKITQDDTEAMIEFIVGLRSDDPNDAISHEDARFLLKTKGAIRGYVAVYRKARLQKEAETKNKKAAERQPKISKNVENELGKNGVIVKNIIEKAKNTNPFVLFTALKKVQENSPGHVLGWVVGANLLINIVAAAFYERTISEAALNAAAQTKQQNEQSQQMQLIQQELQGLQKSLNEIRDAQKSLDPANAKPSAPSSEVVPLESGPNGLWNPKTGENLITLFAQGKTVTLPNSDVSICMEKPIRIPCQSAPKLVP